MHAHVDEDVDVDVEVYGSQSLGSDHPRKVQERQKRRVIRDSAGYSSLTRGSSTV